MTNKPTCKAEEPDWDDCYSVSTPDGEDTGYIGIATDESGHWLWVTLDCNTAHFTDYLLGGGSEPDGPYDDYMDAVRAGVSTFMDWAYGNHAIPEECEEVMDEQIVAVYTEAGARYALYAALHSAMGG